MEMVLDLLVIGLLLYGLAVLGLAVVGDAVRAPHRAPTDHEHAPIFVTRRRSRAGATVATRQGRIRRLHG